MDEFVEELLIKEEIDFYRLFNADVVPDILEDYLDQEEYVDTGTMLDSHI